MNDDLEQVFTSIEKGNALRDEKKFWEAAMEYTAARQKLMELVETTKTTTTASIASSDTTNEGDKNNDETESIRSLYQHQARDYLHRARETLLEALRSEDLADRDVAIDQKTYFEQTFGHPSGANEHNKDNEEATWERLRLFARLFANDKILEKRQQQEEDLPPPVETQQLSLEDRFRALNASLPQQIKSSDERLRDIHKGLRSMGISVPSPSTSTPRQELFEVNAKSDTEQVEDIIAQAKDEARLKAHLVSSDDNDDKDNDESVVQKYTTKDTTVVDEGISSTTGDITDEAEKLMDSMIDAVAAAKEAKKDDNDDESDVSQASETPSSNPEQDDTTPFTSSDLAYFQDRVNEAQTSLAELNAMLDIGDGDDDAILFDADTGKHALDSALRYLQQVQKRWKEAKKRS